MSQHSPAGRAIMIAGRDLSVTTTVLFALVVLTAVVGVPVYGYVQGYTWLDWTLCLILYFVSALGITVGYHRLISHRSFECPDWVKAVLLVAGGWAFENSALKWSADHGRHHARVDKEEDPYDATKGFWYSHCGWVLLKDPHRPVRPGAALRRGIRLRRLDERRGLFHAGRRRTDVPGAELHVLHQFRLPPVGEPALQPIQHQPGQLVGVADHVRRGLSQLPSRLPTRLSKRAQVVQLRSVQMAHLQSGLAGVKPGSHPFRPTTNAPTRCMKR